MSVLVEADVKRDGRTLDHKTLEEMRRMAVQRVREGEKASAVIASLGFFWRFYFRFFPGAIRSRLVRDYVESLGDHIVLERLPAYAPWKLSAVAAKPYNSAMARAPTLSPPPATRTFP